MGQSRLPLTVEQILAWADAHKARTGTWPTRRSGPVAEDPGESWANVNQALEKGLRGLPKGSLHRLLAQHRGVPSRRKAAPLTVRQVLTWARAYRGRTGKWPAQHSGPISEAPAETWQGHRRRPAARAPGAAGGRGAGAVPQPPPRRPHQGSPALAHPRADPGVGRPAPPEDRPLAHRR
jgi:hypothetical protein